MLNKSSCLLIFLFVFNLGFVCAEVSMPSVVGAGIVTDITFNVGDFYKYIYFYDSDDKIYRVLHMGCENVCEDGMTVSYDFLNFVQGDYKAKVYSYDSNKWEYFEFSVVGPCEDGTGVLKCSVDSVGQFCNMNSELVNDCETCECMSGYKCSDSGICELDIPVRKNEKEMSLYFDEEVFLVSDKDWKTVLPFVSATTWTGSENCQKGYGTAEGVCVYPTLIYHEEGLRNFDADSIIDFMNNFDAKSVVIVGESYSVLDNLLVSQKNFGAGISEDKITRIYDDNYLYYWKSFDTVVYVEDDYELALLASTYASLKNAPLIIEGSSTDSSDVLDNRNVICVGDVSSDVNCGESYNLGELQSKYKSETNTKKVILVNPTDLYKSVNDSFYPDKSWKITDLYAKTSLVAPILASAKHELILSTTETDYAKIDSYLNSKLSGVDYLTIMASGNVIPHEKHRTTLFDHEFSWALDSSHYADITGDNLPDVAVGRIAGISNSDVSSYVARVLFYDSFERSDSVGFFASSFGGIVSDYTATSVNLFKNSDYNVYSHLVKDEAYHFDSSEWEGRDMIFYSDHGNSYWSGMYYYDIPKLANTFVITVACFTASTYDRYSFWASAIRNGAIGFVGSVSETFVSFSYYGILNEIYRDGVGRLGDAMKQSYSDATFEGMMIYMGDPTFDFGQSADLVDDVSDDLCMPDGYLCLLNSNCCNGLECSWFTCEDCKGLGDSCLTNGDCCGENQCSLFKCKDCKAKDEGCLVNSNCCGGEECKMFSCGCQSLGKGCLIGSDCCGNMRCGLFQCENCKEKGGFCVLSSACCSGRCSWFKCT